MNNLITQMKPAAAIGIHYRVVYDVITGRHLNGKSIKAIKEALKINDIDEIAM